MTIELFVASKMAEAIRKRYSHETKQKNIVELLAKDEVEISEGGLSRLFNGTYELKEDSRIFKQLSRLFAPEQTPSDYYQYLAQGFNPSDTNAWSATIEKEFVIGLPDKSIWSRPVTVLALNNQLPKGFKITRQQNSLGEPVIESEIKIPSTTQDTSVKSYFSGNLCDLLYQNTVQLICSSKEVVEHSPYRHYFMPLMKISTSSAAQVLVFERDLHTAKSQSGGINNEKKTLTKSQQAAQAAHQTPSKERADFLPTKLHEDKDLHENTISFKELFGLLQHEKIKGKVIYESFVPKSLKIEEERKAYRREFIKKVFGDKTKKISFRTIANSVTQLEWEKLYNVLYNDLTTLSYDKTTSAEITKLISSNAQLLPQLNCLKTNMASAIDFSDESFEETIRKMAQSIEANETVVLCGFSPMNFSIIEKIINKLPSTIPVDLSITRYNLSDMLGKPAHTYLYTRKDLLEIKGNVIKFKELMDSIRWVVQHGITNTNEIEKKLAYFYYDSSKDPKSYYDQETTKRLLAQYQRAIDERQLDYENTFYSNEFTEYLMDKYLKISE
ncbi:MAG: hypothetical protein U0Y10_02800 [Spirosomataceae bacterium]